MSLECTQCEESGEISYSTLKRQHLNTPVKVWMRNLPEGLSESGMKNLFLSVGKPLSISVDCEKRRALVFFQSLQEAELAVRDLHLKPPYNLKVIIARPRAQNVSRQKGQGIPSSDSLWDFSQKKESIKKEEESCDFKADEAVNEIKSLTTELNYDPSLRMRQKKCDFQTKFDCVSMGRGYLFMGFNDRFVGGLQKFESASKNGLAKNKVNFLCKNCNALTSKTCWNCSEPFCSKICLSKCRLYHEENCLTRNNKDGPIKGDTNFDNQNEKAVLSKYAGIPLTTGCTVFISTYLSMNTVFVRRLDEPWKEKFIQLCNDVAVEAVKGEKFVRKPQVGDLVIAKYYQDLCFYRAQVHSLTEEKIILFFIDFGNTQETKLEDLRPLSDYLKAVPNFAIKIQLKDVPEGSSPESVDYFNNLTAKSVRLVLKLDKSSNKVVLREEESGKDVNETVSSFLLPRWKRDDFVYSKLGEVFYFNSIKKQNFEIGETYNLILSHFDEKEFLESEVFWVINPETDDFFHANSEMYLKIKEYCEFLKDDYYLPRDKELCLAKENGEWHRCLNLKSFKTTCCMFFLDQGRSSLIDTKNIRKMIKDFIEAPAQVVCSTLPVYPKLKKDKEIQSKVVQYFKESTGQTITSVRVLKLMEDAYCLSLPEVEKILTGAR